MHRLELGRVVRLRTEPNMGPYLLLRRKIPLAPGSSWRYTIVSLDGNREIVTHAKAEDLETVKGHPQLNLDWAFGVVVAKMLTEQSTAHGVTALSSRTKLYHFQLRPLLKYLQTEDRRLLIADEVGLGKTIEACYILMESANRAPVARTVILCPSHLKSKWRLELYSKFGVGFSSGNLSNLLDLLENPDATGNLVVSLDCANTRERQRALQNALSLGYKLDFLIIDEVHHCIGRASETFRRELAIGLSALSDRVVALSASPVQLEIADLKRVYDVLFPGKLSDDDFMDLLNIVKPLNRAYALLGRKEWDNRVIEEMSALSDELVNCSEHLENLSSVIAKIRQVHEEPSPAEKLELRHAVWKVNPLASFMTRTRKREVYQERKRIIKDFIIRLNPDPIGPVYRDGEPVTISEKELYGKVWALFEKAFSHVHLRQLSSSLPAMKGLLESGIDGYKVWRKKGKLCLSPEYFDNEAKREMKSETVLLSEENKSECSEVLYLLHQMDIDSKWCELVRLLKELIKEKEDRKVIIFTQWVPTIEYFLSKLHSADLRGMAVYILKASSLPDTRRDRKLRQFRSEKGAAVLFSSDILSEGVDLFEADTIINYDLPYNPQKLEQRIGRIDRIGQESPQIRVYNLCVEGSIDEEILTCLKTRIGYFRETIGEMGAILESESEEWASIDETKIVRIQKQMETLKQIEEAGTLTVLDDLLDAQADSLVEESKRSASRLRWLPILNILRMLASDEFEVKHLHNDVLELQGIDSTALELLGTAMGEQEGYGIKMALSDNMKDDVLRITTSPSEQGWFPHLRGAFMNFIVRTTDGLLGLRDDNLVLITTGDRFSEVPQFEQLLLVMFRFGGDEYVETRRSWWAKRSGANWEQIDIDICKLFQDIKHREDKTQVVIHEGSMTFPLEVIESFNQWRFDESRRYRARKQMALNAQLRRLLGRLGYQLRRTEKEDNPSMVELIERECHMLRQQIEDTKEHLASISSSGGDDVFAATQKVYLKVQFGVEPDDVDSERTTLDLN